MIAFCEFAKTATAAETFKDCSVCPTMVKLPAGTFLMGTAAEEESKKDGPADKDDKAENAAKTQKADKDDKADNVDKAEDDASDTSQNIAYGDDDQPQHRVTFKRPFALGQYPVTRGEFAAFVRETGYVSRGCVTGDEIILPLGLSWRNPGFAQTDRHPVVCVSFEDAARYVKWLSRKTGKPYRLPSEAEWEYAARARTTTPHYWLGGAEQACRYANVKDIAARSAFKSDLKDTDGFFPCSDGYVYTSPVGSFRPNAFGLYDMLGNAWQWVEDCYTHSYENAPTDGSVAKASNANRLAEDSEESCTHVMRGGAWKSEPSETRTTYRHGDDTGRRDNPNGFRVARNL